MRVLTLTTLYPNASQPRHGIFVRNRLTALDKLENFQRKVIAPIPYCPLVSLISNRYKVYQNIAPHEKLDGIDVYHPKYLTLPGLKLIDNATSIAKVAQKTAEQIYSSDTKYDLVDGQYLYPDGVAAYQLAKLNNIPLVLTARGSDVNYWMTDDVARAKILEAIEYASKVICVSNALKVSLMSYGVDRNKIQVIINGVDPDVFNQEINTHPDEDGYFLSVGNLIPLKGHDITLKAFAKISEKRLIIVGDGDQYNNLRKLVENLDIQERVRFIKYVDQEKLAQLYAGAKATILMSSMEGMPNVLLESLATGTPVIATNVGGISEILGAENGILLNSRNEECLISAIDEVATLNKSRLEITSTVKEYNWKNTALRQYELYGEVIQKN